jgi:hypothetical protein
VNDSAILNFERAKIDGSLFVGSLDTIAPPVTFNYAEIGYNLRADSNVWKRRVDLNGVRTGAHLDLSPGTFKQGLTSVASNIGGNLELEATQLVGKMGFERTRVNGELRLNGARVDSASFDRVTVQGKSDLQGANFPMYLSLQDATLSTLIVTDLQTPTGPPFRLGGMSYSRIVHSTARDAPDSLIALLGRASFSGDAYSSLEEFFLEQGNAHWANQTYFARRARERSSLQGLKKVPSLFLLVTVRYGRWPLLTLVYSLIFVLLGTFIFTRERMQAVKPDTAGLSYSRFWYSLDAFLPMVNLQCSDDWQPVEAKSHAAWVYLRVHALAGWILIPIGVAALTGLLK